MGVEGKLEMADDNRNPQGDKDPGNNNWMKSLFIWAGIILALVLFVQVVGGASAPVDACLELSSLAQSSPALGASARLAEASV